MRQHTVAGGAGWRRLAVALMAAICLLRAGGAARAAELDQGWPVVKLMAPGSTYGAGFCVDIAQYLLRARGFSVKVDSNFGPQSRDAVRRFQRAHGLKGTGVINAATWRKLIIPLRQGSRGDAVRAVQIVLHDWDEKLPVDGDFGAQTRRVLIAWQRDRHMQTDGVVGPATWRVLTGDMYD